MSLGLGLIAALTQLAGASEDPAKTPGAQSTTQPAPGEEVWLRVTAAEVNIRSRPDANSVPVARLQRGAVLRAVGRDQYGWYQIVPPQGVFSFVSADHVDRRGDSAGVVSVRSGTLRVRVGSLVRELDPLQSEVQALLPRGTPLHIVGQQGGWLKIVPPSGVYVYVFHEYVEPVSAALAAQLRAAGGTTAPAGDLPAATGLPEPATQPISGPELDGKWGQRLVLVETAIDLEGRKPLEQQQWAEPIARLRPIAAQREEPSVARLAQAWITQLERRIAEQDAVRAAEEVLRRAARDRLQHERELERIERARQQTATGPAFAARGELLRSYALGGGDERRWYKLQDPLTRRLEVYVELAADSRIDLEPLLGQYVGVRGPRRSDARLGADVVLVEEVVPLQREAPTTLPTRP